MQLRYQLQNLILKLYLMLIFKALLLIFEFVIVIKMYHSPATIDALISQAEEENLYFKLIEQVNKDFALANENIDIPISILPFEFKKRIQEKLLYLIQRKFTEYLNLLYIIDVSEDQIKKLDGSDLVQLAEQVAFLILKREWQKVWFRKYY